MALGEFEVRVAALAISAAYAAMGYGFFRPALVRRAVEAAPVRARREVPTLVDRLWVATQGWVVLALFVGIVWPVAFSLSPVSLLAFSSPVLAAGGVALAVAGCALVAWASRELGAELAVRIEVREGGRLVTSGPYRRVRHPIYVGVFLIVGGVSLALGSPFLAAYGAVAYYCASVRAHAEEDLFASDPVHGAAYRDYVGRSGRFLPAWLGRT